MLHTLIKDYFFESMMSKIFPNLLFDKDDIVLLQERTLKGTRSKKHLEYAIACCEKSLDPESPHYFDYQERASESWKNGREIYLSSARLATLALTGWVSGRYEYREKAAEIVRYLLKNEVFNAYGSIDKEPTKVLTHVHGKYYMMMALLFDLLYEDLGEEGRKLMIDQVDRSLLAAKPFIPLTFVDLDNNRGLKALTGLSILALSRERSH